MSELDAQFGVHSVDSVGETPSVEWPTLPTETEIYILPDGEIVVADLPVELAGLISQLQNKKLTENRAD